jgi:hypothetical protein
MRWSSSMAVVCVALGVYAAEPMDPKSLDISAEKTAKAKALIAKLNDDDNLVRDKLTAELKAMGRDAMPALLEAQKAKVPNRVLDRVMEVLPAARQADFATRYPFFLADKDRKYDHDLLGWNELRAAVKDTKESRALMADILNDEECREMIRSVFDTSEMGRKLFERRWEAKREEWWTAYLAKRQPSNIRPKADAPVHWVVAAQIADLLYDRDYRSYFRGPVLEAYYFTDEAKLAGTGKGKYGAVVRDFARYWIEHQSYRFGLEDGEWLAREWKFDEPFVRRCLERRVEASISRRQPDKSYVQLAYTREAKYISTLRQLFEYEQPHSPPLFTAMLGEIQVRDAALSMCIALSGQDPVEYGFSAQTPKTTAKDDARYWVDNYYFRASDGQTADDKRKAAFKKWAEWEKANPDAIKAKPPEKK